MKKRQGRVLEAGRSARSAGAAAEHRSATRGTIAGVSCGREVAPRSAIRLAVAARVATGAPTSAAAPAATATAFALAALAAPAALGRRSGRRRLLGVLLIRGSTTVVVVTMHE